jgi:pimeloyl-ACP methyl ester carboxylesterase
MYSDFVEANGLKFHALCWRPKIVRAQAICLHGLGYNAQFWRLVGPKLASAGIEVYAPDARGHGLSDKPESGYDINTNTLDLQALVQQLGIQHPLLIGHSWGGVQALDYCIAQAQHSADPIGLVLIDGGFGQFDQIPGATWEQVRDALSPPDWEGKPLSELESRLSKPDRRWRPTGEARQAYLANFSVRSDSTLSPHLSLDRFQELLGHIWRYPTFEKFKFVACPVMIAAVRLEPPLTLFEQAHQFFNQHGIQEAQKVLDPLQVHWIENGVHEVPLHQPEQLSMLITQFVEELSSSER